MINRRSFLSYLKIAVIAILTCGMMASCGVYSFKNSVIPPDIKTVHVNLFGNRARIIDPALAPNLTTKVVELINNQTKLTITDDNNADYILSGEVTGYDVSTSGIGSGNGTTSASMNRLTVNFHLVWIDTKHENKKKEFNISQNFDFAATLSLDQVQSSLKNDILKNVGEAIFNDVFADW